MTDKTKRLVIAGHSHANTFFGRRLRESEEPKLIRLDDSREIYGLISAFPRPPEYWQALQEEARDSTVVVFWSGNDHHGHFLFEVSPRFDVVRDDVAWVDPSAELVPAELVRDLFYSIPHIKESAVTMAALREAPGCRPMLMETPPPKGDDVALRQLMVPEFGARAQARGLAIDTAPLTHPQTRRKLWRSMCDAYRLLAQEAGVEFLPLPDEVFDDAGCLKREYWHSDATHANEAYAVLVREHLANTLLQ